MKYKEFRAWCNQRACDGCWEFITAKVCINAMRKVDQAPFWKREKVWQKVNAADRIIEEFVIPTNMKIEELRKEKMKNEPSSM